MARRPGKALTLTALGLLIAIPVGIWLVSPRTALRLLVTLLSEDYQVSSAPVSAAHEDGPGGQVDVDLQELVEGLVQPVDVVFPPGQRDLVLIAEKPGRLRWVSLGDGSRDSLLEVDVLGGVEQGLLGVALHPRFPQTGLLYVNYVARRDGEDVSRVEAWKVSNRDDLTRASASRHRLLMEVGQPYQNHNAGQLAFGPDGYLYVGWGDGGLAGDPEDHGQNTLTRKGAMLRIDVDRAAPGKPYGVPADNPFVGDERYLPELYAYGLRNPWRYSFDPRGRLIVADVGQDLWEEISIVAAGDNLGWDVTEGMACFGQPSCDREGIVNPVYVYGRDQGTSITGGFVYQGTAIAALSGRYVFGDFVSGRIWAISLPDNRDEHETLLPHSLGKWPILISSFGRDRDGELYVLAYGRGRLFKIIPSKDPS